MINAPIVQIQEHYFLECKRLQESRQILFDLSKYYYTQSVQDPMTEYSAQLINYYDLGTYCFPLRGVGEEYRYLILKECIRHGRACLQAGEDDTG